MFCLSVFVRLIHFSVRHSKVITQCLQQVGWLRLKGLRWQIERSNCDICATEGIQIRHCYAWMCFVYTSLRFDVALKILPV